MVAAVDAHRQRLDQHFSTRSMVEMTAQVVSRVVKRIALNNSRLSLPAHAAPTAEIPV